MQSLFTKTFYLLYEGEGDGQGDDGQNQGGDGQSQGGDSQNQGGDGQGGNKTFTQDEVNKMLATDRRKNEEKTKKVIGELETLKKSKNLTEQQQQDLSKRIEELQNQLMTKEQLSLKDKERIVKDHEQQVTTLTSERDSWRKRFEKTLVVNAIHKASEEHGAFDTSQIIALVQALSPRVVQEMDETGELKDNFTPRVHMSDIDSKQGKEVTLDLTISEAVKRMKEKPENFNLFKATVNGGLGMSSGTGRSDSDAPPLTDPAAYRKWRQKHLKTQ